MISIRGAITCENNAESVTASTTKLVDAVFTRNKLTADQLIAVIFTITKDLDCQNPATVFRSHTGIANVSLLCVQEAHFTDSLPCCIRILVLSNQHIDKIKIANCYLEDAANLRPDLNNNRTNKPYG